jgi:hypothetical protein
MVDCDPLPIAVSMKRNGLLFKKITFKETATEVGTFGYYNDLPVIQPALIIFVIKECILILNLTIIFLNKIDR